MSTCFLSKKALIQPWNFEGEDFFQYAKSDTLVPQICFKGQANLAHSLQSLGVRYAVFKKKICKQHVRYDKRILIQKQKILEKILQVWDRVSFTWPVNWERNANQLRQAHKSLSLDNYSIDFCFSPDLEVRREGKTVQLLLNFQKCWVVEVNAFLPPLAGCGLFNYDDPVDRKLMLDGTEVPIQLFGTCRNQQMSVFRNLCFGQRTGLWWKMILFAKGLIQKLEKYLFKYVWSAVEDSS